MKEKRRNGRVKHWNAGKSFGFITDSETRKDLFFNRQSMPTPFDAPEIGKRASFAVAKKIVGDRAIDIKWSEQ